MKHANIAIFVPHEGCPNQCSFCNQRRISGVDHTGEAAEVERTVNTALLSLGEEKAKAAEIAFFGGSFTAIPRGRMERLLTAAFAFVREGRVKGVRISTRPDAIDPQTLRLLKAYGVTAVELGAQSMDDRVLAMNRRGHTAQDVTRASEEIRAAGLELGLQMMTGLYGSDDALDCETAQKIIALQPDTVRIYPTIVLEGTALAGLFQTGVYQPPRLEDTVALCAGLLWSFYQAGIPVIRLGLHAGGEIEKGYLAGPWHPALRELCENKIYLTQAVNALRAEDMPPGEAVLVVAAGAASKMAGQKRCNLQYLEQHYAMRCKIRVQTGLAPYEVRVGK